MKQRADNFYEREIDGDRELIVTFLAGNSSAFDQLVLKYKNLVFNLCYRMLENTSDAEDCAQETLIKVYHGLRNFKFKAEFSTWLYRIAVNTCKNKMNSLEFRFRNKLVRFEKPSPSDDGVLTLEIGDDSNSPASVYERKETKQAILNAIRSLPPSQKILVILSDLEERSYQEIVEITGFKLGTVKSKLARARHQLRGKLEGVFANELL